MFVQMHTVPAYHVMLVSGVDEKVGMRACTNRRFQELQAVLHHHYRIFVTVNDKQPRFQPAGFVQQTCLRLTVRILLRCIHVTFTVHHFVIFPVDHRTTGNAHLKYLRVTQ